MTGRVYDCFLLLAAAAALAGCSAGNAPERELMVDVLVELHLSQARRGLDFVPLPQARDSILARYGLDSAAYARLKDYYVAHPDALVDVYEEVLDRLSEERHRQGEIPEYVPPGVAVP